MEKFRKLGIIEPILKLIQEEKFEQPSEIQEKAIPLIIEGRDVIACAATGSGKTLAFASGIIKNTERGKGIQSLILVPTRELAEQVYHWMQRFSKNKHLKMTAVYGGVSINPQIDNLKIADVVIGTPGRILDHLSRSTIKFGSLKILVLDEADRMLDMGFIDDVEKIISQCPKERQTLLFSATIDEDVSVLSKRYMKNAVEVYAEAYVDPKKLNQVYYDVENNQKFSILVHLMKHETSGLVMVFCNTKRNTDFVSKNLNINGIKAEAIHGGYSQNRRTNTMQRFNSRHVSVLVCTDVAARGLDIKGVTHIYNYDIPKDSKEYIHRIGRTARAGKEGKVINILTQRDHENFQRIFNHDDIDIKKEEMPKIEKIFINFTEERESNRRFNRGNRFSRDSKRYSNKRYTQERQSDNYNRESNSHSHYSHVQPNRSYGSRFHNKFKSRYTSSNLQNRDNNKGDDRGGRNQRFSNNRFPKRRFPKKRYFNVRKINYCF